MTDVDASDRTSVLRDFGDVFDALDRLPLPIFAIARSGGEREWPSSTGTEACPKAR